MSDKKACCMCGRDDGNFDAVLSRQTGNLLCIDCAEKAFCDLGFEPELMKQALMESFILQVIKGEATNEDGECNCPRHMYQRLKGVSDAGKSIKTVSTEGETRH